MRQCEARGHTVIFEDVKCEREGSKMGPEAASSLTASFIERRKRLPLTLRS